MKALWETLGNVLPRELTRTRLQLHHAAQLVAAVGRSLVPAEPDDGHTSLEWWAQLRSLTGVEVPGPRPWRAALRLDEPSIAVLAEAAEVGRLTLTGHTQQQAFAWLVERARENGASVKRLRLDAPYAMPEHPVGSGAKYAAPKDDSLAELGRWFSNAAALLRGVAVGWPGSAPVRAWPHHFDIGCVLPLDGAVGEGAPSLSVGLSPGDETIGEPYLYVTPWPTPPAKALPELPAGGYWHREKWTGAVLTGGELVAAGGGAAQAAAASAFLTGTVEVLRARPHKRGA